MGVDMRPDLRVTNFAHRDYVDSEHDYQHTCAVVGRGVRRDLPSPRGILTALLLSHTQMTTAAAAAAPVVLLSIIAVWCVRGAALGCRVALLLLCPCAMEGGGT
jgi:hypothetical protein